MHQSLILVPVIKPEKANSSNGKKSYSEMNQSKGKVSLSFSLNISNYQFGDKMNGKNT